MKWGVKMEQKQPTVVRLVMVFLLIPDNTVERPPHQTCQQVKSQSHYSCCTIMVWNTTEALDFLSLSWTISPLDVHVGLTRLWPKTQCFSSTSQQWGSRATQTLWPAFTMRATVTHTPLVLGLFLKFAHGWNNKQNQLELVLSYQACCYLPSVGLNRFKFQQSTRWHETQTVFLQKCTYVT